MRSLMRAPIIFDGRNLFTPDQMKQSRFTYYSIGRN
jgi:UDPglucose 6-dehydrogenase